MNKHQQTQSQRVMNERLIALYKGDDMKPTCTPFMSFGREMVDRLHDVSKDVLVLSDAGLLVSLLLRLKAEGHSSDRVLFIAHTEKVQAFVLELGVDCVLVKYNKLQAWFKDSMKQTFDVIIGNPPFKAGLHLDFLNLAINVLAKDGALVFVHPSEWLIQKKTDTAKSKWQKELRTAVSASGKVFVEFVDSPWDGEIKPETGRPLVVLQAPLVVTAITPGTGVFFADSRTKSTYALPDVLPTKRAKHQIISLDDVTLFGDSLYGSSFLKKVQSHNSFWDDKILMDKGPFFVNMMRISTGGPRAKPVLFADGIQRSISQRYSVVDDRSLIVTDRPMRAQVSAQAKAKGATEGNEKVWVSFATKIEAENALKFLTSTKFFRALLVLIKIDQNAAGPALLRAVPWLDWSEEWTDARLNVLFKLSSDEVENINQIVDQIVSV